MYHDKCSLCNADSRRFELLLETTILTMEKHMDFRICQNCMLKLLELLKTHGWENV